MYDLTKEVKLDPLSLKKYAILRIALYIIFLIVILFILDRIIFPSASLTFSFVNSNSLKNTLVLPRISSNPNELIKNPVSANDTFIFNANPIGNFSTADFTFTTDKKSGGMENFNVKIHKSYHAFFYPTGRPAGFKNGSLLSSDGAFYIVFGNKLHKFSNTELVLKLGYLKNPFIDVPLSDLQYNEMGNEVTEKYPDGTFFLIGETYYQLRDQRLFPFISKQAFLSQFDANQAIIQNEDFLKNYPVAEEQLEFADGTLASFGGSVYILSDGKSYPIADADTFMLMGFNWDDVVAIDSAELSSYKKQKQFTINQPHPDGTIFYDQTTEKLFLIKENEKHPLEGTVAKTYSKQKYITANSKESDLVVSCQLKKTFFSSQKFYCQMPIDSLEKFIGNDYQIEIEFKNEAKINNIDAVFSTPIKWSNIRSSLAKIKENLKNNYSPAQ